MPQPAVRATARPSVRRPPRAARAPRTVVREDPSAPRSRTDCPNDLLSRCAGDRRSPAWRTLVADYGRYLEFGVRRALRRVDLSPEPALIEDLVQDAYCRLLEDGGRRLGTFRGTLPAELGAWLRRLAERTALDHLRAAAAWKRGGATTLVPHDLLEDDPSDPSTCPLRRVEQRERLRHFVRRCKEIPGGERGLRILGLVLAAGWTSRELARASGGSLSSSGIDSLVYRLRRRLRDQGLAVAARV